MSPPSPCTPEDALSRLILELFRLNGRLLAAGDRLARRFGQTSARWQVLGALAGGPRTVPQIARAMGLTRQSVQRTVDGLEAAGLVSIRSNPAHRRSHLLALSVAGSEVLRRIHAGEVPWAARLAAPLGAARIRSALELLTELREALDGTPPEPTPAARAARGRRSRP